ncbi:PucR family transcriptional regulator [Halopolyspora algeriensis]|nr:PucR family transcriptional regulator [Halopolyspora algeriensis]
MHIPTGRSAARPLPASAAEALLTLSHVVLDDLDDLADRLTQMVLKREPSYAQLDLVAHEELRNGLRSNVQRGLQSLAGDVPQGADPQDVSRETGRQRARQGIPLEAVLRAYRLGGRMIWEALLTASREHCAGEYDGVLLDAAGKVWRMIDSSSSALTEAYREEEARVRSQELDRRNLFVTALLEGRGDEPGLAREAAQTLGLPEDGPLLCLVAPVDSPRDEPLHAPHDVLATRGFVSSWHVRPAAVAGLVALGDRSVTEVLRALEPAVTGRVGVSPVIDGLAEVGIAYGMAETAAHTLREPGLATLDDRLPEALLLRSPELLPRLRRVAFGKLRDLPEADRQVLLGTLEAVLACSGSATHAAQRLYCHRNTVLYRLQRIETLTGRKVADPRDRMLLTLGLMAGPER